MSQVLLSLVLRSTRGESIEGASGRSAGRQDSALLAGIRLALVIIGWVVVAILLLFAFLRIVAWDSLEPLIVVNDPEGFSAQLGSVDLVTPRTGEQHKTSAASLVLFGKDSKVLWSAP